MTDKLSDYRARFHAFATAQLPTNKQHIGQVFNALHYSFSAGGKRLRPALVYALAESLSIDLFQVDVLALAVECIHTYSLIHDDLPAMDDDDLRRGKPSCHKQFGESTAILAGDALNTWAFELLGGYDDGSPAKQRLKQMTILANCSGLFGMVGGQDTDLSCENSKKTINLNTLSQLHQQKTARLIEACFLMTYLASEQYSADKEQYLSAAALSLGLFYQIQDDILDVIQSSAVLGKPKGSDDDNGKVTYVSLLGLEGAKQAANESIEKAGEQLQQFFAPDINYTNTTIAMIVEGIFRRQH
ncbi:MAG: polyprenyl synthetase family protein [Ostreibacterium sp.]